MPGILRRVGLCMCEVQCAGWDLQRRATERKKGQSWRVAGGVYLEVTGGTNKNRKVPHLDEGVCLLIHHRSVSVALPAQLLRRCFLPSSTVFLPSFLPPQLPSGPPLSPPTRLTLAIVATRQSTSTGLSHHPKIPSTTLRWS